MNSLEMSLSENALYKSEYSTLISSKKHQFPKKKPQKGGQHVLPPSFSICEMVYYTGNLGTGPYKRLSFLHKKRKTK